MSESLSEPGARINLPEYTVSDLSHALKRTVEDAFAYVRVRGEISGYRGPHTSGHAYFALKDENAKLDAVCFKGVFQKLKFKPQEGLEVIVTGRITTYPGKSAYQIIVEAIEPAGVGALLALLEERKKKLAAEGLFDPARKKPLPYLPEVIGVITSPTGAVIRDILHRLSDRFPRRVLVWPVTVQGEKAAGEVAAAIAGFNALQIGGAIPRPDLIIVARGGGSIEDLWAFNEESVVRAVAASAIPVISAVGHETDTTLIDFVSDIRAPTPTAAAEMAVPVRSELLRAVGDFSVRLSAAAFRRFEAARQRVSDLGRALPRRDNLFQVPRQRLDTASGRLGSALLIHTQRFSARLGSIAARLCGQPLLAAVTRANTRTAELGQRMSAAWGRRFQDRVASLNNSVKMLETLSYQSTLGRGFALVRSEAGGLICSAKSVARDQILGLEFADGALPVRALEGSTGSSPEIVARPKKGKAGTSQGDLF
jgi:exodeoxyribonuclease VII large subunit